MYYLCEQVMVYSIKSIYKVYCIMIYIFNIHFNYTPKQLQKIMNLNTK